MPTCKECRHAFIDESAKTVHCRRYPPALVVVHVMHPMTRQAAETFAAAFPTVNADASCGEFAGRPLKLDS